MSKTNKKVRNLLILCGKSYLEEKRSVAVGSPVYHTNGKNIRLELKPELTLVQHPA